MDQSRGPSGLRAPVLRGSPFARGSALAYAYAQAGALRPAELQGLPRGGMDAVADAFASAATAAGADVLLDREVVGMDATGVELATGERIRAAVVVSSLDPMSTARLAGMPSPKFELGPAAAKLHVALRGEPDLSRLIGDDDPATLGLVHVYAEWDWYARAHEDATASLVELQLPTYLDESLAPRGEHCLSAYMPFAGGDMRALMWRAIERAIPNARDVATAEVLHGPSDFERRLGFSNIHHIAHAPGQMFDARPESLGGIALCGAGAYPGGEVSGLPGLNAALRLLSFTNDSH